MDRWQRQLEADWERYQERDRDVLGDADDRAERLLEDERLEAAFGPFNE